MEEVRAQRTNHLQPGSNTQCWRAVVDHDFIEPTGRTQEIDVGRRRKQGHTIVRVGFTNPLERPGREDDVAECTVLDDQNALISDREGLPVRLIRRIGPGSTNVATIEPTMRCGMAV